MADSGESADSWPGFLAELSKGFLILRDVFGYALPGAVFLAVGLLCRRFSLRDLQYYLLEPYKLPPWLALFAGLCACYAIGHVMSTIAYLFHEFGKFAVVSATLIQARGQHPEFFIELDRQSTMAMMRGATGMSLLLGSICFWWLSKTPPLGWMLGGAGILLLAVFRLRSIPHIQDLTKNTAEAATTADASSKSTSIADLKGVLEQLLKVVNEIVKKIPA